MITTLLAFVVVMLGAYTRLKDGGLGCPDWPGCYGHVAVPSVQQLTLEDNAAAKIQPLESPKAWAEMVHRYFAGSLSLAITVLLGIAIYHRKKLGKAFILPCLLFGLLIFQAVLGMWTVTWLLYPLVVMSHLVGGISIMTLLWVYGLYCSGALRIQVGQSYRVWAMLGLIIVVVQIILGGWTSSNYAALACPDFPYCNGKLIPLLNFKEAFLVPLQFGPNYQGGLLTAMGRETIQFMHRAWAFLTLFYLLGLIISLFFSRNKTLISMAVLVLGILLLQFALGVLNVVWQLPLVIAVAHNGVAALLLLAMATLNFSLFCRDKN
ncbi:MAG: COX15/CtaA family protein [Gammaproteobacteria bacterium]|nr:COX15/CtaA family protein [Gammaproteobacteria bacterium]